MNNVIKTIISAIKNDQPSKIHVAQREEIRKARLKNEAVCIKHQQLKENNT